MFVRTLIVGLSCSLVLSTTAAAQCGSVRHQPHMQLARQIAPIIADSPGQNLVSSVPTITELAKRVADPFDSRYQSCESHRIQNQQWATKQDAALKRSARVAHPVRRWTPDELAASKFQAAHGFWKAGRPDAARRWLEMVLRDFGTTPTADRARAVLAKL